MQKLCADCEKLPWGASAKKRCICSGFNLDLGCGGNKQRGFLGADKRNLPNVDLVFDIENVPTGDNVKSLEIGWPIPDNTVDQLLMSHVLEHMKPWLVIDIMNEMWRVMHPRGQAFIAVPYAGSFGFWQDPTHMKGFNEATWAYFDPSHNSHLYDIYAPHPWKVTKCIFNPIYNMEVILEPRKICQHQKSFEPGLQYSPFVAPATCGCCWNRFETPTGLKQDQILCMDCRPLPQKSIKSDFINRKKM